MDISLLLIYTFSVFMLIIIPGPVVALVVSTSLACGPKRAVLTALGTNWAALVLVMVSAFILTGTLSVSEQVLNWISLIGCLFIAYMSFQVLEQALRSAPAKTDAAPVPKRGKHSGLVTGFLVGISNPKDIIFFVSFFPQFIHVTASFKGSIALLSGIYVILDLTIMFSYIFLMRQKLALKYKRKIEIVSSLTLLLIALAGIFYSGSTLLNP
ncbi:LysE family translocator [Pseudomonas syringae pv. aptata]|jgi:threonine/homoserine/homoserine lactone efflux protein|uniref:Efflux protein, LysE family n=1 Tax=Pseudomonas syringae pv. japonica str. M301072 TaxID=629262 RepID=F3FEW2_PSESX|nr:LysE family translocator [Pseudomonas syringae]EGH28748.1 efflux protein, LysE family [Pseudomonas syringae pv. japonica str. M301072]ELP98412.1 efflux protein, LysE family [Pseudomonas syringae BRIP34876]ELQ00679.1 efflux protein, LysE family [Pseudomonas syringae BRIP34881]ELS42058.1 LysE family efflux protein [Pseudomonas syringae pv. syringae B64]EPF67580.1 Homoserine/lysine/threonine efflux protein, LysE/YggA family [Pseudomonas syringae pv. syringae SM]